MNSQKVIDYDKHCAYIGRKAEIRIITNIEYTNPSTIIILILQVTTIKCFELTVKLSGIPVFFLFITFMNQKF